MKISVLIPVYNTKQYLLECVESILNQTISDIEIILCDDCSTDGSGALCDKLAARFPDKITAVHNLKNYGLLSTRRELYKRSSGDWVLCVDSDDLLEKNALFDLEKVISENSPDMVVFNLECFHIDGRIEHFKPDLIANHLYTEADKNQLYDAIYSNHYLNSLCTKAYKRGLIDADEDYSQYKDLKIGEDLFQSYPLFDRAKRIFYLDKSLYKYRKNEFSMTQSLKYDLYEMRKPLWSREDEYWEKWKPDKAVIAKANTRRIKEIIGYLRNGYWDYGIDWLTEKIDVVNIDGWLLKAFANNSLPLQYNFYSKFVLFKRVHTFAILADIEKKLLGKSKSN